MSGMLSVVATPIGNMDDITLRALKVFEECDGVVAEDSRRTRSLLSAHGLRAPITSLPAFAEADRIPHLLERLLAGEHLVLCTDSGTPAISDPGRKLVNAVLEADIDVEVIPGPSAITAAISISGLDVAHFAFLGFAPRTFSRLSKKVEAALDDGLAVVFYESPHRLAKTLDRLADLTGDRRVVVAREVTKVHETIHRGTCASLAFEFQVRAPRGEITVIIEAK